jgi:hypothetical protein
MKNKLMVLITGLLPLLAGCGGGDTLAVAGLIVEIREAGTGAAVAYDAVVTVRDGSYSETVIGSDVIFDGHKEAEAIIQAAYNRPGTYEITITHPRYRSWTRGGVRVERGDGSSPLDGSPLPKTVRVTAELQPSGGS